MKRVINELSYDEVHRGTGMKVGNFGTGGRTYSRYTTGSSEESNLKAKRIIVGIILCLLMCFFYATETGHAQTKQCATRVQKEATPVYPPFDLEPRLNNQLIYAASQQAAVNSPAPLDPFFGVSFPSNSASVQRYTEYCQWDETTHIKKVKVGRDPNCRGDSDRCNIYREDKTYTYYKAWRSHRINSAFFDNPTAYHNPQRDPAPSETFHAENGIRLDGNRGQRQSGESVPMLTISAADASEALTSWSTISLGKTTAQATQVALSNGFNEADSRYIYSRGAADGWTDFAIKAGFSYLADGVVDWGENLGTCKAGDIRVSFKVKTISPKGMAVAGRQMPTGKIIPFKCGGPAGGEMVVGTPDGSLSLHPFGEKVVADSLWWTNVYRLGQAVAVLILLLILRHEKDAWTGVQSFSTALFLCSAAWAFIWLWESPKPDAWIALPLACMAYAGYEYRKPPPYEEKKSS